MSRYLICLSVLVAFSCSDREPDPYDLDFDIPRSENFKLSLSDYNIYQEPFADLSPSEGVVLYELSSELFTDYAKKQRLIVVPNEGSIKRLNDTTLEFPEGTILVKTFYYPLDMREPDARRIIETRLLIKTGGVWNVGTYLWNDAQTDAELLLDGTTTNVTWIDDSGTDRSTEYVVPHEGECVTCHQSDGVSTFIGPTIQNLNRNVVRDENEINQLSYLASQNILDATDWTNAPSIPNYNDTALTIETRARAYLDMNCSHCHNPDAWKESSRNNIDFRFTTPLEETEISDNTRAIQRQLEQGRMPYLGTTVQHREGVGLVLDFIDNL